jgi:hypothetical protein
LWMRFTREVLNLGQEVKAKDVHSFVCRFGKFSVEVRTPPSSVGMGEDRSPLNPNAKEFRKQDSIGKSRLENSTGKGEARGIHQFKRELFRMRAQVKELQDKLDGKKILDHYDFNWTPPSASEDTSSGLQTHIRHLRRKKAKMCELLESVSQVVFEDKETDPQVVSEDETGKLKEGILESMEEDVASMTEKFDEGKRGGAEPEVTEADVKRMFLWSLQYRTEEDVPEEDILEKVGATKEVWIKQNRILGDDEPHDDDLCWLGVSKESFFKTKRRFACVNAFGINYEEKMRKYWNAFKDGCKGRDVSEMGRVMEENFVMNGISTSSAT